MNLSYHHNTLQKQLINNNCKIVNIIWVDRGILLSIISFIIDNYTKLLDKIIIINNKRYREFLRIIFNQLEFKRFKTKNKKNFYFNIRKIIVKQDVVIDYLQNYNDIIKTNKINLIPWYDTNDPIILYELTDNKLQIKKYKKFIKNFGLCRRGNYNNTIWDLLIERYILIKYNKFNYIFSLDNIFNVLNKYVLNDYTNTLYVPINYTDNLPMQKLYQPIISQQCPRTDFSHVPEIGPAPAAPVRVPFPKMDPTSAPTVLKMVPAPAAPVRVPKIGLSFDPTVPVPKMVPLPKMDPTSAPKIVPAHVPSSIPSHVPSLVPAPAAPVLNVQVHFPKMDPTSVPKIEPAPAPGDVPTPAPVSADILTPAPVPAPADVPTPAQVPVHVPTPAQVPGPAPVPTPTVPVPTPTQVPVPVPADIPADVPADVPVDVPADVPVDVPAAVLTAVPVPADVPADVPVDVPADVHVDGPGPGPAPVPTPAAVPPSIHFPAPRFDRGIPDTVNPNKQKNCQKQISNLIHILTYKLSILNDIFSGIIIPKDKQVITQASLSYNINTKDQAECNVILSNLTKILSNKINILNNILK